MDRANPFPRKKFTPIVLSSIIPSTSTKIEPTTASASSDEAPSSNQPHVRTTEKKSHLIKTRLLSVFGKVLPGKPKGQDVGLLHALNVPRLKKKEKPGRTSSSALISPQLKRRRAPVSSVLERIQKSGDRSSTDFAVLRNGNNNAPSLSPRRSASVCESQAGAWVGTFCNMNQQEKHMLQTNLMIWGNTFNPYDTEAIDDFIAYGERCQGVPTKDRHVLQISSVEYQNVRLFATRFISALDGYRAAQEEGEQTEHLCDDEDGVYLFAHSVLKASQQQESSQKELLGGSLSSLIENPVAAWNADRASNQPERSTLPPALPPRPVPGSGQIEAVDVRPASPLLPFRQSFAQDSLRRLGRTDSGMANDALSQEKSVSTQQSEDAGTRSEIQWPSLRRTDSGLPDEACSEKEIIIRSDESAE